MKLILFGATGGLGVATLRQALDAGHQVSAFVRTPAKLPLQHPSLTAVQGDVLDRDAVARAIPGHEAVISALGPAQGTPAGTLISTGTRHIVDGMTSAGVRRFVFTSGLMVGPCAGMNVWKRALVSLFRLRHRALYLDKVRAESLVRDSGLDWIIVRPPVLADVPARGSYRVGPDLDVRLLDKFAFADVGHALLRALTDDGFRHSAIELTY